MRIRRERNFDNHKEEYKLKLIFAQSPRFVCDSRDAECSTIYRYGLDTMGAYGICFALAVYSICRKNLRSRRQIIMLVVVVYLYAASVTQYTVDCWTAFRNIYFLFMTTDIPVLLDRAALGDAHFAKFVSLLEGLFDFNMIIADAVVIWRTWAVYQGQFRAIAIPCVLLLGAFVFAIIDMTCAISDGLLPEDGICQVSAILVWAFSVATNIVCTVLIAFKAWKHRKMMKELSVGGIHHGMSTENVLSLLVESGFIYSLIWASEPTHHVVLAGLGRQITGMYPTLIIVIVNFQRTIWEESPITLGASTANNSLQWAIKSSRSGATKTVDTHLDVGIHLETFSLREDSGSIKKSAAGEI
ncbi:hypothetical protein C8R45DRAFT_1217486 [Mycena sanguinolenta]|nr:hypothetical protein C8R45DRAFT_1217486 [Mycena sanguinolenta]